MGDRISTIIVEHNPGNDELSFRVGIETFGYAITVHDVSRERLAKIIGDEELNVLIVCARTPTCNGVVVSNDFVVTEEQLQPLHRV